MQQARTLTSKHETSHSYQILIGAALGILAGLFFGERMHILAPIGNIYTMLLQVAIFPFIVSTLLSSLGKLNIRISWKIFREGWVIYAFLILITFGTVIILSRALPEITTSLRPTQAASETVTATALLNLIIPDNVFAALANNYVPAVVIFCILFGIMLQRVSKERFLFNFLDTISQACLEYWNLLIIFAPIAAFIALGEIAGTIRFEQLQDLSEYIILFYTGTLLLTFWLLPGIISSLTDLNYRDILKQMFNAMLIAFATTLPILAIPYIKKLTEKYWQKYKEKIPEGEKEEIIDTILLISYPLAQLGNIFIYLFMIFATVYFNQPITQEQSFLLPISTFLSSIGSPTTSIGSINFLSTLLNLSPTDTYSLYDSISPITQYGEIILTVMGFAFLSILITSACYGRFRLHWKKLFTHLILVGLILLIVSYIGKNFIPDPGLKIYQRLQTFSISPQIKGNVKALLMPAFQESKDQPVKKNEDSLYRIQRTGVLRVGYPVDGMPFSFFNNNGELVGFDIAYMYQLAQAMRVDLQFIPFSWSYLIDDMRANKFDIAVGAIIVSPTRLEDVAFTDPYLRTVPSLIVLKSKAKNFHSVQEIQKIPNLKIGVGDDPLYINLIKQTIPNAQPIIFPSIGQRDVGKFLQSGALNAMLWYDSESRIWTLGHPSLESVNPQGLVIPFMQAYMVQSNSPQFLRFVNYWLRLKENEGFKDKIYRQWLLAQPIDNSKRRWSIMDNVLDSS